MTASTAIVIINFQGRRWLPRCVSAVRALTGPVDDVLVVDNASTDDSLEALAHADPDVRVVRNRRNEGFARACNRAMAATRAEFVAIVNTDVVLSRGWLHAMLAAMEEHPAAAATASKLRSLDARAMLAGAGGRMNWQGYGWDRGAGEWDTGQYNRPERVFAASGAAMLIRRSAYETVGPFDEAFFMYHEDVDWCWRAWLRGFEVWYVPQAVAFHKGGATSRRYLGEEGKARFGERHRIRSVLKCYERSTLRRVLRRPELWSFSAPTLYRVLRLGPAVAWNLCRLSSTLRARRAIQATRARSDEVMRRWIWPDAVLPSPPRTESSVHPRVARWRGRVSVVDAGINDVAVLGAGWLPLSQLSLDPELHLRWSQRDASLQLWQPPGAERFFAEVYSLGDADRPVRGRVSVDGLPARPFCLRHHGWARVEAPLAEAAGGRWITVAFHLEELRALPWDASWLRRVPVGLGLRRAGCVGSAGARPRCPAAGPRVSVIIPTRNRAAMLERTLRGLASQTYPADQVEVVVVDDGSTDETRRTLERSEPVLAGRLRSRFQLPRGAAAARNAGLAIARGDLVILLDDDIFPERTFVAEHVAAHRARGWLRDVAIVGYTGWPTDVRVTPWLAYIGEYGPLFGYRHMPTDLSLPCKFFYSSNLSMPRAAVARFDETFANVWDDIELGYRLMQAGLELFFHSGAVGRHQDLRGRRAFEARQRRAGSYAVLLARRHPELAPWLGVANVRRPGLKSSIKALLGYGHPAWRMPLPSRRMRWYQWRLHRAYRQGLRDGRRRWGHGAPEGRRRDPRWVDGAGRGGCEVETRAPETAPRPASAMA